MGNLNLWFFNLSIGETLYWQQLKLDGFKLIN